jgi:hypothetical protein
MARSSSLFVAGAALLLTVGCGSHGTVTASLSPATSTADRMTVRTGEQLVTVDSPLVAGRRVERMIHETGGYLEQSSGTKDGKVRIVGRVPAAQLDSIMDVVAGLGSERRRATTGKDVTDQYTDLEARLKSSVVLRDRLQQLLARAATLDEVLTLERQIARLQTDIDGLQSHIDRLKSQASLASLSVNLDRKRVLGPLAAVGHGLAWAVGKLFVIR